MAKVAVIQTSTNIGEVSPLLLGRVDFDKYKSGLKTCLNHIPMVQGPITRRPGTIFAAEVKDSSKFTRLVRFEFSVTQAYVLEFGNTYVRIYRNHGRNESPPGTPVEVSGSIPYLTAELPDLMFAQSADVLYIAHPNHPPASISRSSDTSWSYSVLSFTDGPYLDQNQTPTTLTFSAGSGAGVTCTASAITGINGGTGFQTTDVGRHIRAQMPGGNWGWATITARSSTTVVTVTINQPFSVTTSLSAPATTSPTGTVGNATGISVGQAVSSTKFPAGASVLAIAGQSVTLSANASATGTDAAAVFGGSTLATTAWKLGLWSATTGWPASVTFYQERLCWGGCTANPESVQLSVTGNYLSHQPTAYDTAGTVVDSHAMNITLSSNDVQNVRWMSGDANGLLIGTVAGEWALSPSSLGGALTPTNLNAVQMTAYGNAKIRAVRVGYTTLMVQRSLRKVRELTFVYYENRYHAPDMTTLSQHITLGGLTDMAYQQEPHSIVWFPRVDGTLVGMTYERDQNVVGWHRHIMGGTNAVVESCVAIPAPDGTRDELWMIVRRTVNGATKRYVEYMTKVWEHGDDQQTCVYADAALQYSGGAIPAGNPISGLSHLIGETVCVLADGALHDDCVVNGSGQILLTRAASKITAGLRYNSDGETLRNDAGSANGTAQGKTQRTHRVTFRFLDTLGFSCGPDFSSLDPRIVRTNANNAGQMVPLYTGDDSDTWDSDYTTENLVCWRFSDPLPGTVIAVMPQLSTFDR